MPSKNKVEIFSAGTWNGDKYTTKDLDEMVSAFNDNKVGFRPPLKLGHNEEQKLLQQDGLPSAGWVDKIYRVGDKLLADFIDIPKKIFELLEKKAYRKVSSEIYWNMNVKGKVYRRMLGAVALLGADNPGVMNLDDILALYKRQDGCDIKVYADQKDDYTIKSYDFENKDYTEITHKEIEMPQASEKEINLQRDLKDQKAELDGLKTKMATFTQDQDAKDKELTELKKFKQDQTEVTLKLEQEKKEAEFKAFKTDLKSKGLMAPSMEPYIDAILGEDKKEYKIDDKKTLNSKQDALAEMLKVFSKTLDVNFDENSESDDENKQNTKEDVLNEKIVKYSQEHKVTYAAAYKAVMSEEKED